MSQKEKFYIYGAIIFMFLFSFYWLSLNPYLAKKDCAKQADQVIRTSSGGITLEEAYNLCLLRKGLK